MRPTVLAALGLFVSVGASAQEATDEPAQRPQALVRLLECRNAQSADERLACYDREVAAFEAAESARELVVYDREQVRRTRRSLFGIALPNLNIFGRGDGDADREEFSQIETTIRGVRQDGQGRFLLTLEDGARWQQTDNRDLSILPRAGHSIKIRQAAMGSYLANVAGQTAIRVRRVLD